MKLSRNLKSLNLDGRWFLAGSHISLILVSYFFFDLQRSLWQILVGLSIAVLTEFVLAYSTRKYTKIVFLDRFLSSFAEGAGLLVLLKSSQWWFYGLMSFIAVSSKYAFRKNQSSHIFNPTNFAIVFGLAFFPLYWFEARTDDFTNTYSMVHVTLFGIMATILGGTFWVSISYIVSLIFWISIFFPMDSLAHVIYAFGPEFGTIGLIYLWLMITDPKTAPRTKKYQFLYAFCIAFIHISLRHQQYLYSRYIAAFIVTMGVYAWFKFQDGNEAPRSIPSSQ